MSRKGYIQYKIDEDTFELKPDTNVQIDIEYPFIVSLVFSHNLRFLQILNLENVTFSIQKPNEVECWIISDYGKICITIENSEDWQKFLNSNFLHLMGLIFAALITKGREDFLWILPSASNSGKVWIIGIVWNKMKEHWDGMLVERPRPADLNKSFWFIKHGEESKKEREQCAKILFIYLKDRRGFGLPDGFPFCSNSLISSQLKDRQLTIKVHNSELWFLVFPIDYFCQFNHYGQFSLYKEVEWIFTLEKSFIQNILERLVIQRELQNVEIFLKHSVVIFNTYYSYWAEKVIEKTKKGTALISKIFSLLQNIEFDTGERLSLRWHLNPTNDIIQKELLDQNTWYFFANFHLENKKWQIDEGKSEFGIDLLVKEGLSHIRLMRIFHCHSIVTPEGTPSIGPLLLESGVQRVEGSIMEEDYLVYLCSLLYLSCHSRGLQPILRGKCYEEGINFNNIIKEIDDFLKLCNWETVGFQNLERR